MKLIRIFNKQNKIISDKNIYKNPTEFIDFNVSINAWGKPERWIIKDSEIYEESDVIQTEEKVFEYIEYELNELGHTIEVKKERIETWVKLRADYTIEVVDLEQDYDWLLSEVHRKRVAEYPPLTELGDALYWKEQGDDSKYVSYMNKCEQVKKKYPLPIRSE